MAATRYTSVTDADRAEMLAEIGVDSLEALLAEQVPEDVRFRGTLDLPAGMSEPEVADHLARLAARNVPTSAEVSFLGMGAYDHYVPAVVDAMISRSEFQTAYTPYQPEVSQGTLQAIFEFQTSICALTGLPVANASMYDGATAAAEAALMARAHTRRDRIVVSRALHPHVRGVIATSAGGVGAEVVEVGVTAEGTTDRAALADALAGAACVVLAHPNAFGRLEDGRALTALAHQHGALAIAHVDPHALGVLSPPGAWGADVAVGEGGQLGNHLAFGGPWCGFFAVTRELVRRMPGRLVGETVDGRGERGFVLTLQTREQHIRREKATSNICSNQALNATAATVYLAALGPAGLAELGEVCARRAASLRARLVALDGVEALFDGPVFKEFCVRLVGRGVEEVGEVVAACRRRGVHPGFPLGREWPEYPDALCVAVTERRSPADLDRLVAALGEVLS